jgi:hypothetical protein
MTASVKTGLMTIARVDPCRGNQASDFERQKRSTKQRENPIFALISPRARGDVAATSSGMATFHKLGFTAIATVPR